MTKLKNPSLFVSSKSGLPISKDNAESVKFTPAQMAEGVSEKVVKS